MFFLLSGSVVGKSIEIADLVVSAAVDLIQIPIQSSQSVACAAVGQTVAQTIVRVVGAGVRVERIPHPVSVPNVVSIEGARVSAVTVTTIVVGVRVQWVIRERSGVVERIVESITSAVSIAVRIALPAVAITVVAWSTPCVAHTICFK